jgi:hypothetical protein
MSSSVVDETEQTETTPGMDFSVPWTFYLMRLFTDERSETDVRNTYLMSYPRTNGNGGNSSILPTAAGIAACGGRIYILDSPPKWSGYEGFEYTRKVLVEEYGVLSNQIEPVPFLQDGSKMVHTRNEAHSVISFFASKGIEDFGVLGTPYHLPRAYLTFVATLINDEGKLPRMYPVVGKGMGAWYGGNGLHHSQNSFMENACDCIEEEVKRVKIYHEKGDVASVREALQYLKYCTTSK